MMNPVQALIWNPCCCLVCCLLFAFQEASSLDQFRLCSCSGRRLFPELRITCEVGLRLKFCSVYPSCAFSVDTPIFSALPPASSYRVALDQISTVVVQI
ncbi:hypothetical protein L1887_39419 [Cichorium endivia]|nr:hypothetical protein L1887_39419 [Cichorium endivia]